MSKHFEIIFYLCQLVDIHSRGGTDNTSFQKYFWIVEIFHQIYILRMWSDLNYCIRQHCYNYTKHRLALKLHKTNSFKIWIPNQVLNVSVKMYLKTFCKVEFRTIWRSVQGSSGRHFLHVHKSSVSSFVIYTSYFL